MYRQRDNTNVWSMDQCVVSKPSINCKKAYGKDDIARNKWNRSRPVAKLAVFDKLLNSNTAIIEHEDISYSTSKFASKDVFFEMLAKAVDALFKKPEVTTNLSLQDTAFERPQLEKLLEAAEHCALRNDFDENGHSDMNFPTQNWPNEKIIEPQQDAQVEIQKAQDVPEVNVEVTKTWSELVTSEKDWQEAAKTYVESEVKRHKKKKAFYDVSLRAIACLPKTTLITFHP